jgi:hypothetical protein
MANFMAGIHRDILVLPVGVSCINQFQMRFSRKFAFRDGSAYPFDWAITTPDTTIEILEERTAFVNGLNDLEIINGRVRSTVHPGIYFWHINWDLGTTGALFRELADLSPGIDVFIRKHQHMVGKLSMAMDEVHCLWSNIQPNLQSAVETLEPWENFRLTEQRYAAIKEKCSLLQAKNISVSFVCRAEDADPVLHERPDVFILECPRSEDFKGKPGLFDPVFDEIFRDSRTPNLRY